MLEKMDQFFENRLNGYEDHMLTCIESAQIFYPFTASCLPLEPSAHILDLGCGTGLELNEYFRLNPTATVTGIDLTEGMLTELNRKFADRNIRLILGSYFDIPFGQAVFDAAVSVESLHHFTQAEKIPLYTKLHKALKDGGYFILTDYFALDDRDEQTLRQELLRLKQQYGLDENVFYHFDTPLTVAHEIQALAQAGFSTIETLDHWGQTYTIRAFK